MSICCEPGHFHELKMARDSVDQLRTRTVCVWSSSADSPNCVEDAHRMQSGDRRANQRRTRLELAAGSPERVCSAGLPYRGGLLPDVADPMSLEEHYIPSLRSMNESATTAPRRRPPFVRDVDTPLAAHAITPRGHPGHQTRVNLKHRPRARAVWVGRLDVEGVSIRSTEGRTPAPRQCALRPRASQMLPPSGRQPCPWSLGARE